MGRFTAVALLLAQLIAISLACAGGGGDGTGFYRYYGSVDPAANFRSSYGGGDIDWDHDDGGSHWSGGFRVRRSSSGHPLGLDLSPNTVIYPDYNSRTDTFRLGLEHRPNDNTRVDFGVDVDSNDQTRGKVGLDSRLMSSIENEALHDIDISRKLFEVLDINGDNQLDVKEWFDDGGKVRPFSEMIGFHDNNSDEMISLEEFFAIPVDPALIAAIEQMMKSDQN